MLPNLFKNIGLAVKYFIKENWLLCIITIISATVVMLCYGFNDEIIVNKKWIELIVTVAIGINVNFLFYVFQVFYPKYKEMVRAQKALEESLYNLYSSYVESVAIASLFFERISENKIILVNKTVAYKMITGKDDMGLARRIDIKKYISMLHNSNSLAKAFTQKELFCRCDIDYMDMIIKLRDNTFFDRIIDASTRGFKQNIEYGGEK